jgi:hypothetical protein
MIKTMHCPECGADIKVSYITPEKSFRIDEDGKIVRDDAWTGPGYDDPHFKFYCSEDREHDLGDELEIQNWQEDVEHEFKRQNLFA